MLVLLLTQAVQPTPPRDAKSTAATGTAVIAGRVVDAETGTPIVGALLQIGPMKIGERATQVEAGPRGEFRLDGLAAGDYTIIASPPEFRATHLPQVHNGDFVQLMSRRPSLQLASGEKREDVVIRLPRAFAVDGMVVDEFGDPMANISVRAELLQVSGGGFLSASITATRPTTAAASACSTRSRHLPHLRNARDGLSSRPRVGRRLTSNGVTSRRATHRRRLVAANAWTISASAAPILTIVGRSSQGYTIAGRATSESGVRNVYVNIERLGDRESTHLPVEMQDGGRFTARGVTPGNYRVSAYSGESPSVSPWSARERARMYVEVTAADLSGIELVTTKGVSLVGRVAPSEPLPAGTRLSVAHAVGLAALAQENPWTTSLLPFAPT